MARFVSIRHGGACRNPFDGENTKERRLTTGRISLDEFKNAGKDSLPIIGDFKDLGHHYDEESE